MNKVELMKKWTEEYTKLIREEQKHKQVLDDLLDRMWNELTDEEKMAVIHGIVLVENKILELVSKRLEVREKLDAEEIVREEQRKL